eukprot:scaffold269738_cov79-Cyclotella_meneghiniana.AAC.1
MESSKLLSDATTNHADEDSRQMDVMKRRLFLKRSLQTVPLFGLQSGPVNARGLVRFPCKEPLLNKYHFMRAGTSLLEEENVWSTNPLFLTNREAALSELGESQVRDACKFLASQDITPIVRYSLAAASVDSANIVGDELKIGRDRLVPEFNYMDPRAIGAWDFAALNETMEAVWAMDESEAGLSGRGGLPPANEDGTPAETLGDQVVRLTNLISVLETLYSGDDVLLIFPDGTGPGEIRCNIDYQSVTSMASQLPPQSYSDVIKRGQLKLQSLRDNPDVITNVKDLKYDEEKRIEAEIEKKTDAKKRQEAETRLAKKKDFDVIELDPNGAATLVTSGVVIGAAILSSPEETNHTILVDSHREIGMNETLQNTVTNKANEFLSDDVIDEDVELFMRRASMVKQSEDLAVSSSEDVVHSGNDTQGIQPDYDYNDVWLGTISDILNEDETRKKEE